MRRKFLICNDWRFSREDVGYAAAMSGAAVTLPHSWNAEDGQGGGEYFRGACWYGRCFARPPMAPGDELWIEFGAANAAAEIWCNGRLMGSHAGGYSAFRVNLTAVLADENILAVRVDNRHNAAIYPQSADFTFYGGIYRDVYLITVPASHFVLDDHGSPGIRVTPEPEGPDAHVRVQSGITGPVDEVRVTLLDAEGNAVAAGSGTDVTLDIANVHRWHGRKDPYLYRAVAELIRSGEAVDCVEARFGCRSFRMDPQKGFYLNDEPYLLRGVARHQDRDGVGNAITPVMMQEDMAIIAEMGANTIRLAHYQHDQYFYDLCDQYGMVVWAEIPFISAFVPEGCENTLSQMTELITQNYNHPSIVAWGIANEVTMRAGREHPALDAHLRALHGLTHRLDATRVTTTATDYSSSHDDSSLDIPDIMSWNLYYGWYYGEMTDLAGNLDEWHRLHPGRVMGLSEFGADAAIDWQTPAPVKGDYSEAYQALIHENILETVMARPWLWATHVWNMFDFGAAHRCEGGKYGQNRKGLVTFDRKIKKDAFYIYKAWLSDEPFVHLCGSRYIDRAEEVTEIKVYSNQRRVTLYDNGQPVETLEGEHIFRFRLPLQGEHRVIARAGNCSDSITVRKVAEPNPNYSIVLNDVVNWVDRYGLPSPEGYYGIFSTVGELLDDPACGEVLSLFLPTRMPLEFVRRRMSGRTVYDVLRGQPEDRVFAVNEALNQIKKARI